MEQLQLAIAEVTTRLAQVEEELGMVGQDLDPLDAKAATHAVMKKAKLSQERDALLFRLPALEAALQTAIRQVAEARVAEIRTEVDTVTAEAEVTTARFAELLDELIALFTTVHASRQRHAALTDEGRYLSLVHELATPTFAGLPVPDHDVGNVIAQAARAALHESMHSSWGTRFDMLWRERAEARAKLAPKPELKITGGREPDGAVLTRQWEERERQRQANTLDRVYPEGTDHGGVRIEGDVQVRRDSTAPRPNRLRQLQGRED